jgi:hypothetical protein
LLRLRRHASSSDKVGSVDGAWSFGILLLVELEEHPTN